MDTEGTVYHVRDQRDASKHVDGKQDHFFGSIAAIFTIFQPEDIGITKRVLYGFDFDLKDSYSNDHVVITKGKTVRCKHKR